MNAADTVAGWIRRHSYLLLTLAVLPAVLWRVMSVEWMADFWEHAAVIREFAARPLDPGHPMLAIDAPHALNSPYHLLLGLVSRATGVDAIVVLNFAALPNFVLFTVAFRSLVRLFTRAPQAPFIALLFTLFLWGIAPLEWSGFFHIRSFSNVMPYPSTVATATAFLALVTIDRMVLRGGAGWALATLGLATLTLAVHPASFVLVVIGGAALVVERSRRRTRVERTALVAAVIAAAVVVAGTWPYYPLFDLAASDRAGYLRDNDSLLAFGGTALRTFPALIGVPFLVARIRRRPGDALVLVSAAALAVWLVARETGIGSLAPTIRFAILALHIAAAAGIAVLVARRLRRRPPSRAVAAVIGVVVITLAATVAVPAGRSALALEPDATPDLAYLRDTIGDGNVVMTDDITALEVPAWGPKVVAWHYAMPFVEDRDDRREVIAEFFDASTSEQRRQEALDRYCARWVLLVPERQGTITELPAGSIIPGGQVAARAPDGRSTVLEAQLGPECRDAERPWDANEAETPTGTLTENPRESPAPGAILVLARARRGVGQALDHLPHALKPRRLRDRTNWAIGMYGGTDPLELAPIAGLRNPVIRRDDIHDVDAGFVADPFLFAWEDRWYLFFEIFDWATGNGAIGVASSPDARAWRYEGVAVREAHHLSYPFPIAVDGVPHLMIESFTAGTTRAYRAVDFPRRWEPVADLIDGKRVDPTPFEHGGRWYLFTGRYDAGWRLLDLHVADNPLGPFVEHPASPIVSDLRIARPAGRVIRSDGRLLRFGQDNRADYGARVWAAEIVDLSPTTYAERPLLERPVLASTGRGWNRGHMHHVDAHRLDDGSWLASVDGW